ncbi:hypothetical protein [Halalkalibacillus halophilus]|uniref:hypothetical protein n=1 Tax=Halalkalibacillus halophilus TaxID=392827 RepID=UPI0003FA2789|nr:hypothetical protein [Halalkalibacillus halophilus]
MLRKFKLSALVVVTLVIFAACSQSEEEALNDAENRLKDAFLSTEINEENYSLNMLDIYKPEELEVSEDRNYNVIFTDGERPFVLFINEFEAPNSKWFYNNLEENEEELFLSTFENEDAFTYLHAIQSDEDQMEIHLGIGGIKMSTISNVNQVEEDVEMMINMIRSIDEN